MDVVPGGPYGIPVVVVDTPGVLVVVLGVLGVVVVVHGALYPPHVEVVDGVVVVPGVLALFHSVGTLDTALFPVVTGTLGLVEGVV